MSSYRNTEKSIYSKRIPNTGSMSIHCESYRNGDFYLGTKVHSLWSGTGLLITGRGGVYEGGFSGARYHGNGYLTLPDGRTYAGQFVKGIREGYGKLTEPGKSDFIGEFRNGKRYGIGILKDVTGRVIKGTFVDGVLEGHGFVNLKDSGYEFKGKFSKGVYEGIGQENHKISKYLGFFCKGKKDGIGYMKIGKKAKFLGNWILDERQGFGIEHFENDDMYEGDFKDNDRTGVGKYMYKKSGYSYIGEFLNGQRHGFGKLEGENLLYIGNWNQNRREGMGYQRLTDGRAYFGYWKNDLRHGLGYEFGNEVEYKGNWRFDKPDGIGIVKVGENVSDPALFKEGVLEEKVEADISAFMKKIHLLDLGLFFSENEPKILQFDTYIHSCRGQLIQGYKRIQFDSGKIEKIINSKLKKVFSNMDLVFEDIAFSRARLTQICEELSPDQVYDLQSAIRRSDNWFIPKGGKKGNYSHYLKNIGYRDKNSPVRDFEKMRNIGNFGIKDDVSDPGNKEGMFNEFIFDNQETFGMMKTFDPEEINEAEDDDIKAKNDNLSNIPSSSRLKFKRDDYKRQKTREKEERDFDPFKGRTIGREEHGLKSGPIGQYHVNDQMINNDREREIKQRKDKITKRKKPTSITPRSRKGKLTKSPKLAKSKNQKIKGKSKKKVLNQFSNQDSFFSNIKDSNIDPKVFNTDSDAEAAKSISRYSETPSMKFGIEISERVARGLSGERPVYTAIDPHFVREKPEPILLNNEDSDYIDDQINVFLNEGAKKDTHSVNLMRDQEERESRRLEKKRKKKRSTSRSRSKSFSKSPFSSFRRGNKESRSRTNSRASGTQSPNTNYRLVKAETTKSNKSNRFENEMLKSMEDEIFEKMDRSYEYLPQDMTPMEIESLRDKYQPSIKLHLDEFDNQATKSFLVNNSPQKKLRAKKKKKSISKAKKLHKKRNDRSKSQRAITPKLNVPYKNHPHKFVMLPPNSREGQKLAKYEDIDLDSIRPSLLSKKSKKDRALNGGLYKKTGKPPKKDPNIKDSLIIGYFDGERVIYGGTIPKNQIKYSTKGNDEESESISNRSYTGVFLNKEKLSFSHRRKKKSRSKSKRKKRVEKKKKKKRQTEGNQYMYKSVSNEGSSGGRNLKVVKEEDEELKNEERPSSIDIDDKKARARMKSVEVGDKKREVDDDDAKSVDVFVTKKNLEFIERLEPPKFATTKNEEVKIEEAENHSEKIEEVVKKKPEIQADVLKKNKTVEPLKIENLPPPPVPQKIEKIKAPPAKGISFEEEKSEKKEEESKPPPLPPKLEEKKEEVVQPPLLKKKEKADKLEKVDKPPPPPPVEIPEKEEKVEKSAQEIKVEAKKEEEPHENDDKKENEDDKSTKKSEKIVKKSPFGSKNNLDDDNEKDDDKKEKSPFGRNPFGNKNSNETEQKGSKKGSSKGSKKKGGKSPFGNQDKEEEKKEENLEEIKSPFKKKKKIGGKSPFGNKDEDDEKDDDKKDDKEKKSPFDGSKSKRGKSPFGNKNSNKDKDDDKKDEEDKKEEKKSPFGRSPFGNKNKDKEDNKDDDDKKEGKKSPFGGSKSQRGKSPFGSRNNDKDKEDDKKEEEKKSPFGGNRSRKGKSPFAVKNSNKDKDDDKKEEEDKKEEKKSPFGGGGKLGGRSPFGNKNKDKDKEEDRKEEDDKKDDKEKKSPFGGNRSRKGKSPFGNKNNDKEDKKDDDDKKEEKKSPFGGGRSPFGNKNKDKDEEDKNEEDHKKEEKKSPFGRSPFGNKNKDKEEEKKDDKEDKKEEKKSPFGGGRSPFGNKNKDKDDKKDEEDKKEEKKSPFGNNKLGGSSPFGNKNKEKDKKEEENKKDEEKKSPFAGLSKKPNPSLLNNDTKEKNKSPFGSKKSNKDEKEATSPEKPKLNFKDLKTSPFEKAKTELSSRTPKSENNGFKSQGATPPLSVNSPFRTNIPAPENTSLPPPPPPKTPEKKNPNSPLTPSAPKIDKKEEVSTEKKGLQKKPDPGRIGNLNLGSMGLIEDKEIDPSEFMENDIGFDDSDDML